MYREGKTLEYDIKPTFYEERYILGIVMKYSNNFTFGERIYYSYWKTIGFVASVGESLKLLVTGRVGLDQMTGPVGISNIVIKTTGIQNFINLLALISVSLGVTNLLPIPALDGGRLLIFVVEAIRRKPLEENLEMQIQAIGFSFLILLSIYVTYNDIFRIFEKDIIQIVLAHYLEPKLCSDKILNLMLIEKNPSQCLIGLDFKFLIKLVKLTYHFSL